MTRRDGARLGANAPQTTSASSGEPDKALSNNNLPNSRGGTRTRDPGIMSAVL